MACNEQPEEVTEVSDVNCNEKDKDVPQTSPKINSPNEKANNMNDLKLFEFNSADDVRQRMREVLVDGAPDLEESDVDFIAVGVGDQEHQRNNLRIHVMSKLIGTDDLKLGDKKMPETVKPGTSRKRPGRPPKAGPSKKRKKQRCSTFYWGKLSNVVFLKRKHR